MSPSTYPQNREKNNGFTLIEMTISVGILIVIMGLGLFLSMDFYRSYAFLTERNMVISILQKARSNAMANINEKPHGVYFEPNNYVLFEGENYAASANKIFFESSSAISHSGISEVVFEQLSGKANVSGGDLILKDNIRSDIIISINYEGRIYQK